MPLIHMIGLGMFITFLGMDVYLAANHIPGDTWSELTRNFARLTPVVPFLGGMLSGHFWHPVEGLQPVFGHTNSLAMLIWLSWLIVIIGIACKQWGHPIPVWSPLIPGFIAGCLLWPCR